MDRLVILQSLDDAIRIIVSFRALASGGSQAVWNLLYHAENHLNKQMLELLAAEAE